MHKRERFYECVFEYDRNEYRFHVRAWSESEAEVRFRETLRGDGVTYPGTLLIRNARGRVVRRAAYAPSTAKVAMQ